MDRLYGFLFVALCLPVAGIAQSQGVAERPSVVVLENLAAPDSVLMGSAPKPKQMFDTHPMPNAYQENHAIALPNAHRGDNCVAMPNAYQESPAERVIIKLDSASKNTPDSLLLQELDKLRDTLNERKPEEQP